MIKHPSEYVASVHALFLNSRYRIFAFIPSAAFVLLVSALTAADPPPLSPAEKGLLEKMGGVASENGRLISMGGASLDRTTGEVSFPVTLNMREGLLEVIACTDRGRLHESLFVTDVDPLCLQLILILSGARNGAATDQAEVPRGDAFRVLVQIDEGEPFPVERWLREGEPGGPTRSIRWIFVGSLFENGECLAVKEGNVIDVNSLDRSPILEPPPDDHYEKTPFEAATEVIDGALGNDDLEGADEKAPAHSLRIILRRTSEL